MTRDSLGLLVASCAALVGGCVVFLVTDRALRGRRLL